MEVDDVISYDDVVAAENCGALGSLTVSLASVRSFW
jgi:hypothetical protein